MIGAPALLIELATKMTAFCTVTTVCTLEGIIIPLLLVDWFDEFSETPVERIANLVSNKTDSDCMVAI